ncbi:MAG: hypothetical protein EA415_11690 [Sphaerobacteraceae bacterium]|nr:MAG: hypothetical protein EA415_11690 [Sphaerobacteraceae bacterium]
MLDSIIHARDRRVQRFLTFCEGRHYDSTWIRFVIDLLACATRMPHRIRPSSLRTLTNDRA